jgi:hypothetical protein
MWRAFAGTDFTGDVRWDSTADTKGPGTDDR